LLLMHTACKVAARQAFLFYQPDPCVLYALGCSEGRSLERMNDALPTF